VALDAGKAALLLFVVAILQVAVFSDVVILGGTPNLLLVTLVCVALLRGSIFGAIAGFCAGLVIDVAYLDTVGATSLLLTLAGYWTGRYGETSGRERGHAPYLAVAVLTVLYAIGALLLRFILGDPAPARVVLLDTLFQTIGLHLLLTAPVAAIARKLLPVPAARAARPSEIELVG
jgi:rod shape-determining protein MreD